MPVAVDRLRHAPMLRRPKGGSMTGERRAELVRRGGRQTVYIPADLELPYESVDL